MNEGVIVLPTYIELDIPSPMAERIRDLRKRFDFERSNLPAEISLSGSGGTGTISQGQNIEKVLELINAAAKKIEPFTAAFDSVHRFPGTDIFFLTFKDDQPFIDAQKIIAECGVRFDPSPYPYKPHCTLRLRKPPENTLELLELTLLTAPDEEFTLSMLSVFSLPDAQTCELLTKTELGK